MPTIDDVSIINWNTAEAKAVASGLERILCSEDLCGSKTLTVYQRTVQDGRQFEVKAGGDYHLLYVIEAPKPGVITFNGKSHAAEEGAGVLLVPGMLDTTITAGVASMSIRRIKHTQPWKSHLGAALTPTLRLRLLLVFRQLAKFLFGGTGQHDFPPVVADLEALVGNGDQVAAQTEKATDLEDAE